MTTGVSRCYDGGCHPASAVPPLKLGADALVVQRPREVFAMTRHLAPPVCVAIVLVCASPAIAQDARASEAPAHISFVDGSATLERDGQIDSSPASMPLLAGDRIRTQGGRVEVLFGDGSTLYLDANSTLDFQSDAVVRLLDGRIRLAIAGPPRAVDYRVDAPSAWVQITE